MQSCLGGVRCAPVVSHLTPLLMWGNWMYSLDVRPHPCSQPCFLTCSCTCSHFYLTSALTPHLTLDLTPDLRYDVDVVLIMETHSPSQQGTPSQLTETVSLGNADALRSHFSTQARDCTESHRGCMVCMGPHGCMNNCNHSAQCGTLRTRLGFGCLLDSSSTCNLY